MNKLSIPICKAANRIRMLFHDIPLMIIDKEIEHTCREDACILVAAKPHIHFFCVTEEDVETMSPVARVAVERGYECTIERDVSVPADVGFYCHHSPNPENSKFSLVMLHDLGQEYWPEDMTSDQNFWKESDWSGFDVAFLAGDTWVYCWRRFNSDPRANPRIGVFKAGYPKSDKCFNSVNEFKHDLYSMKEELALEGKRTVLFATSWETSDLRNLRCMLEALKHNDVNLLIKYWPGFDLSKVEALKVDQSVHILNPGMDIMSCLAVSDVIVSDESNCMVEALLFGIPSISVTDWMVPELPSLGLPERPCEPPIFSILSSSDSLSYSISHCFQNYASYKARSLKLRDEYFVNLGNSSSVIMDLFEGLYYEGS